MERLTDAGLNRATLARQGLLEPLAGDPAEVVRAIGAVQSQQWTAVPVALAARTAACGPAAIWAALEAGELVTGIGIRGTLHLVAADEHPAYATTARAGGIGDPAVFWRPRGTDADAAADRAVCDAVLGAASDGSGRDRSGGPAHALTPAGIAAAAEAWVAAHPGAYGDEALEVRRALSWRPLARRPDLVRVPAPGKPWSATTPPCSVAAPWRADGWPDLDAAVAACVRAHLRAFGPASVKDTAQWLGVPARLVRAAHADMDDLVELEGPGGRILHDLAGAPRPDPEVPAPPRFLAAFDSLLLAYAPPDRGRILTPALHELLYRPGNLRIDPAFLVDGRVAGTWTLDVKRRVARIALQPGPHLAKRALAGLEREGDRLLALLAPDAGDREVVVA